MTSKSSLPVFTINYLLRSVLVISAILQSLTILTSFSLMPIFSSLGKYSQHRALGGGRQGAVTGSLRAIPRASLYDWEGSEYLYLRRKGWCSSPVLHRLDHELVLRCVSGLFCCLPLLMNLQAIKRVIEPCDAEF